MQSINDSNFHSLGGTFEDGISSIRTPIQAKEQEESKLPQMVIDYENDPTERETKVPAQFKSYQNFSDLPVGEEMEHSKNLTEKKMAISQNVSLAKKRETLVVKFNQIPSRLGTFQNNEGLPVTKTTRSSVIRDSMWTSRNQDTVEMGQLKYCFNFDHRKWQRRKVEC
jgi:hypothetical protein